MMFLLLYERLSFQQAASWGRQPLLRGMKEFHGRPPDD
jgi:hypothetical protein